MKNLTFKNREELEARGYSIKENSDASVCQILKEGEEEAKILINEEGVLELQVQGKRLKDLLWIEVHTPRNPLTVLLEMEGKYVDKRWCEIPPRGNLIFW